jgi:Protein of unknown function (DUF3300)
MHTSGSRSSTFTRLQIDSPDSLSTHSRGGVPLRSLIALAMALLVVPVVRGQLLAQEGPEIGEYPPESGYQQPGYAQQSQPYGQQSYPQQENGNSDQADAQQGYGQPPLNAQDLQQLVAPIALYPDALIAQVLTASTYPEQVADADRWLRGQGYAPPDQIAAGADAEPWDPSVKALTAFPQVLSQMDQNLHWTSELGAAYYNQPQDTLQAVQEMRQRARAAGNLQSTPQEAVDYEQGNIEVSPASPQMVYVPSYNPWTAYGDPISPYPGFSLLDAVGSFFASSFGSSAVRFGAGIAMSAFTQAPWGWLGWGLNWLTQSVLFNHSDYFSHSATVADWGLRNGGSRAFSQRGAFAGRGYGSSRNFARYGRTNGEYGRARSQGFARTRTEDAYARNRSGESHGYQTFGARYGRALGESNRRFQPAVARSQQNGSQRYGSQRYGSSAYGSSFRGESNQSRGSRAGANYGSSMRANRGHDGSFQRSGFGNRYSASSRSNGFAKSSGKREHSGGGSHFGGGHNTAKNFGGGKSFSHGHSGGGGHSGGHSHSGGGGKHHH